MGIENINCEDLDILRKRVDLDPKTFLSVHKNCKIEKFAVGVLRKGVSLVPANKLNLGDVVITIAYRCIDHGVPSLPLEPKD